MDTNIINRNTNNFNFVETLGSFINNYKFKKGFDDFKGNQNNKGTYLWQALSVIGNDYAEVIYENVLNYIDNVSNVDMCKVKALQSMMKIVGIQYDVIDAFSTIPVELARLIDLLSINSKYLLDNKTFQADFIDLLKSSGVIKTAEQDNEKLSSEFKGETLSSITDSSMYIDESKYSSFLYNMYYGVLSSFVYMKYADGENGISATTENDGYIYEYLQDDILAGQMQADTAIQTTYESKMSQLKIKYGVDKNFDQQQIVDDIENGYDSFDNYNIFEQEILQQEINRRQATYSFDKSYRNSTTLAYGMNLTRYSYYREKKVKEYFKFIENTYNNLIVESNIKELVEDDSSTPIIDQYKHDVNYFNVNQQAMKTLLVFNEATNKVEIETSFIDAIARLLVQQTFEIAQLRDQVKLQIRKSYMRGTFLLVSYIINEFLKSNISQKYGSSFQTEDGQYLKDILDKSIADGGNVELIEYYDNTEYFNITRDVDDEAVNSKTVNEKFWDNTYSKIGVNTEDLPLDEIDEFYKKQLKLENNNVDDLVNFLSIIYEYGANNSYISNNTKEYTCLISGKDIGDAPSYIGDPYNEISTKENDISLVEKIHSHVDSYIEVGYQQTISSMSAQLDDLCGWVSSYYWNEISTANKDLKDTTIDQLCSDLEAAQEISETFAEISSTYETLKTDSRYSYYLTAYRELSDPKPYFIEKLHNFKLSVENKISWHYSSLNQSLTNILTSYYDLSSKLYNNLFVLSVWPINYKKMPTSTTGNKYWNYNTTYWPYYSPQYNDELTTVTTDLKNYLTSQVQVQHDGAMQHLQNHYNMLLGFKDEINQVLQKCNEADAKLNAFAIGVQTRIGKPNSQPLDEYSCIRIWSEQVDEIEAKEVSEYKDGLWKISYKKETTAKDKYWLTEITSYTCPAVNTSTVEGMLNSLIERTNYPKFPMQYYKENALVATAQSDFGPCTEAKIVQCKHQIFVEWDDDGVGTKTEWVVDETLNVPSKYTTNAAIAYLPETETYPYASDSDASIKNDILAAYNNAVANLTSNVELINNELTCLGYSSITVNNVTIDNVKSKTQNAYSQLINRISSLKTVIQAGKEANGWQSLVPKDSNLTPYSNRLKSISAITLSSAEQYNVVWIGNEFNKIQLSVQQILANNSDYFEDFVNNDADRIDKQIFAISTYMNNRDTQASAEVLSQALDISSQYFGSLADFNNYSLFLNRKLVYSINDDYSYNLSTIMYRDELSNTQIHLSTYKGFSGWPSRYKDCLDYLLSGDYINQSTWKQQLSGVIYWLSSAKDKLEESIVEQINDKIPRLQEYIDITNLIQIAKTKYARLIEDEDEDALLTDKLDQIAEDIREEINFISSQIPFYDESHEIYLKYNGTEIGYDPFYNYKNQAYSSYQIHPYLYNFVEKTNLVYPLANSFFVVFGPEYEHEIYTKGLDNLFGPNGNIKDLWKNGMLDWTGYQSSYERQASLKNFSSTAANPIIGFKGLFYPPALDALLNDHDNFIQAVQDNREDSFYYHLNYSDAQRQKVYDQILAYENVIEYVATSQYTGALSGQFDIYKYAEDCMGNSLFLLKSYKHLYESHADDPNYSPSYHDKRNTLGEIWMRPKDCPLAFPAFDLRPGYESVAQYSIAKKTNSYAQDINEYVLSLDLFFKQHEEKSTDPGISTTAMLTRDSIGECQLCATSIAMHAENVQHLRCFYDFETDVLNQSLLLVVPYKTGRNNAATYFNENMGLSTFLSASYLRYADSSIIVGYLGDHQLINIMSDQTYVYNFTTDVYASTNTNVNDIANPQMLINGNLPPNSKSAGYFYEFIGFTKYKTNVYALFVKKLFDYSDDANIDNPSHSAKAPNQKFTFVSGNKRVNKPQLELRYVSYKCHLEPEARSTASDELLYDCYDWHKDLNQIIGCSYINASNVAVGGDGGFVTISFVTERFNPKIGNDYPSNSQIVNFAEYSSQVESYSTLSSYGTNVDYPRSTALIQTTDSQHINIYNSFDSFAQYLVNVNFKFVGKMLKHNSTQYFNLNSDIGFLPQYVDRDGLTRYYNNTALSNADSFNIQLLGPEKSDIPFTPVIKVTTDEKYGRVVEDYKNFTSMSSILSTTLSINANASSVTHVFQLSSIYVDSIMSPTMTRDRAIEEWKQLIETPELLRYKYILYNTDYLSQPILKGNLSDLHENGYYYQSSEKYDLLSGEEIVGPNSTTYQSNVKSNHIDGISSIGMTVTSNSETQIPQTLRMTVKAREIDAENTRTIDPGTFYLLLYAKNTMRSYQYYHLFENANADLTSNPNNVLSGEEAYALDLSKTSDDLSSVKTYTGKHLFENKSGSDNYHNMKAMAEFKYSEEDPVDREFPFIDSVDVEDEITIVENDSQSIYYFAIDSNQIVDLGTITMKSFQPNWVATNGTAGNIVYKKINTTLPKYADFFNRALIIEATYNLEQKLDQPTTTNIEYEHVLYFNYMNYTNPQYVYIDWPEQVGIAPTAHVHNSTDDAIKHTYLELRPGQSGRLDIRVDFLDYQRLTKASISQSIVGVESYVIATYYIMNTSDEKPKFIVSRTPFSASTQVVEEENYELDQEQ